MSKGKPPVKCLCVVCGSEFYVSNGEAKRGGGKYCSRQCYKAATEVEHVQTKCGTCGKVFQASNYRKRGVAKYCSKECSDEAHKKQIDCICQVCGTSFTVSPSQIARGEGKFCSHACFETVNRGTRHPHWRGGTFHSYGLTWKSQRKIAYERDGGVCQHCGLTEKQAKKKYGYRNSVHHIIKRRTFRQEGKSIEEANALTNLLTLCPSCHKKAEAGKITLRPKLF